jgi:hypothetical protein
MNVDNVEPKELVKIAVDHAWNWFALHATQRLQSVNFFLVAMAFMTAAYVTAIKEELFLIAAGIAVLAMSTSYFLFRMERRIQYLIHAAEEALNPIQDAVATKLTLPQMNIVARVAETNPGGWKYSRVFKFMYSTTAAGFALGFVDALLRYQAYLSSSPSSSVGARIHASGVVMLITGTILLNKGTMQVAPSDALRRTASIIHLLFGAVLVTLGTAILIRDFLG